MGKLIELIIDEQEDAFGVEAISLVKYPAIEHNWVFFSKDKRKKMLTLAEVNEDQRTIVGPALIPDKEIPRFDAETDEEYHVYFSKDTVKQASELFLKHNRANMHTFEHETAVEGVSVVESWIVSNPEMDKSNLFSMDVPEGTWMVRLKIDNEEIWETIKDGTVQGLSIEGYFVDKIEKMSRVELEGYSDYPESVRNNAQAVLDYVDENGWGGCGTDVGKQRANQLAKGEAISLETVKRMKSYLERHAGDLDSSSGYGDGCGKLMYDAWGGKSALSWAESTINKAEKEKENMSEEEVNLDNPCWEGYEMVGMKMKDGKEVPNCVPIEMSKKQFSGTNAVTTAQEIVDSIETAIKLIPKLREYDEDFADVVRQIRSERPDLKEEIDNYDPALREGFKSDYYADALYYLEDALKQISGANVMPNDIKKSIDYINGLGYNLRFSKEEKMSLFSLAKELFTRLKPRKMYAELPLSTGGVLVTEDEEIKLGSKVYTLDEEGKPIDVKDGAYTTQSEVPITVLQGLVTEYDGEKKAEEVEEEKVDLVSTYKEMYKKKLAEIEEKKTELYEMDNLEGALMDGAISAESMEVSNFLDDVVNDYRNGQIDADDVKTILLDVVTGQDVYEYDIDFTKISMEDALLLEEIAKQA